MAAPTSRHERRRRPLRSGAGPAAACAIVYLLLTAACSATTRYEWLSFFFDGVPDPNRVEPADPIGPPAPRVPWAVVLAAGNKSTRVLQHAPYATHECAECHADRPSGQVSIVSIEQMAALRVPLEQLCDRCHEPPTERYVHAPANLRLCTFCHHPHQSFHPSLLLEPRSNELCVTCHTAEVWPTSDQHLEYGERDCCACHDPHASQDPMLLRDGWEDLGPPPAEPLGPPAPVHVGVGGR